jgi:hypothetical protein
VAEVSAPKQGVAATKRRDTQVVTLRESTIRWLAELPEHLRPKEMATRFPHIANRLAVEWPTASTCRPYFDDLLLDSRGDRKGFPERVALELAALKNYYDAVVFPTHQTVWDEIISRSRD